MTNIPNPIEQGDAPMRRRKRLIIILIVGVVLVWLVTHAFALPSSRRLFEAKYGYKATCDLCHEKGGGSSGSDYGKAFLRAGANFPAFAKLEKKDSDGDGASNLEEIQARSNPGDPRSTPDTPGEWLANAGKIPIPDKPLKELFAGAEAFSAVEGSLNDAQIALVQSRTGEALTEDNRVPTFYFAIAQGKRYEVAQFIRVEGAKEPLSVAVAVDLKGRITNVKVLKSKDDPRFKEETFLGQFRGKTFKDTLKVGVDLNAVPRQDRISETFASEVRKALWTVQAVFAKPPGPPG